APGATEGQIQVCARSSPGRPLAPSTSKDGPRVVDARARTISRAPRTIRTSDSPPGDPRRRLHGLWPAGEEEDRADECENPEVERQTRDPSAVSSDVPSKEDQADAG